MGHAPYESVSPQISRLQVSVLPASMQVAWKALAAAGGRPVLVGGWVRDTLWGLPSMDWDWEVYGLSFSKLEAVLSKLGVCDRVGAAYGVLRFKDSLHGDEAEFALPRRDIKVGAGHRGFKVDTDPHLSFAKAALRRDFRINAMGWDPNAQKLYDPLDGVADLKQRLLHPADPRQFAADPLRALRAMYFVARFALTPSQTLLELCAGMDVAELSKERIAWAFQKLLLASQEPSIGFKFLKQAGLLGAFPMLAALEPACWERLLKVIDALASSCHQGLPGAGIQPVEKTHRWPLMLAGVGIACGMSVFKQFGQTMQLSGKTAEQAQNMVSAFGCMPSWLAASSDASIRQETRRLWGHVCDWPSIVALSAAGETRKLEDFWLRRMARLKHLGLQDGPKLARVTGQDLMAHGLVPGPEFAKILALCLQLQDEGDILSVESLIVAACQKMQAISYS